MPLSPTNFGLTKTEYERYISLAVLPKGMPAPLTILQTLWGVSHSDATETASRLVSLSLAHPDGRGGIRLERQETLWAEYPDAEALKLIHSAHELARQVIAKDPDQYAAQMVGRLFPYSKQPGINVFVANVTKGAPHTWLRPTQAALNPAGTALVRAIPSEGYNCVTVNWKKRLVVCWRGTGIQAWDLDTGADVTSIPGSGGWNDPVLAVSEDGRIAVTGSEGRKIEVWNLQSGSGPRLLADWKRRLYYRHSFPFLRGAASAVESLAVSADGKRLVSATAEGFNPKKGIINCSVEVWDLETGNKTHTLIAREDAVRYRVAITSDGRRAVVASDDDARIWDLETGLPIGNLSGVHVDYGSLAIILPGEKQAMIASGAFVGVWDLDTGGRVRDFPLSGSCIALSNNGRWAAVWSTQDSIEVVELETGSRVRTFDRRPRGNVALDPSGHLAVTTFGGSAINVWDLKAPSESPVLPTCASGIRSITPDWQAVVAYDSSDLVTLWDLATSQPIRKVKVAEEQRPSYGHHNIAVSADGRVGMYYDEFFSYSRPHTMKVWDLVAGAELHTLVGHTNNITAMGVDAIGRIGASVSIDKTLRVWDLASGRELQKIVCQHGGSSDDDYFSRTIRGLYISADGRRAVCATRTYTLTAWDLERGRQLHTLTGGEKEATTPRVAVSGDGTVAVSSSNRGPLDVWDLGAGKKLFALGNPAGRITAIAISGDRRFAASCDDNALRLWNLADGTLEASLTLDGSANYCSFVGGKLVAVDWNSRIHCLVVEKGADPDSARTTHESAEELPPAISRTPRALSTIARFFEKALMPLQGIALFFILIRLGWRAMSSFQDIYYTDWIWRHANICSALSFFAIGFGGVSIAQDVGRRYSGLFARIPLVLFALPTFAVWLWYPTFDNLALYWFSGHIGPYHNFTENGKTGCMSDTGRIVVPVRYDILRGDEAEGSGSLYCPGLRDGLLDRISVSENSKWGQLDARTGAVLIQPQFDNPVSKIFSAGLASVKNNNRFGFVTSAGKLVIPFEYEEADYFSSDHATPVPLAAVKKDGKWGYIDPRNRIVIPFQFDEARGFGGNGFATVATVRSVDKWKLIDAVGRVILDNIPTRPGFVWLHDEKKGEWEVNLSDSQKFQVTSETKWASCGGGLWYPDKCPAPAAAK